MNSQKRTIDQVEDTTAQDIAKRQQLYREPSIFNTRPMDDITKLVHDFIAKYCDQPHVEVKQQQANTKCSPFFFALGLDWSETGSVYR